MTTKTVPFLAAALAACLGGCGDGNVDDDDASDPEVGEAELAVSIESGPGDQVLECLGNTTAQLTATAASVNLGQSVTLNWHSTIPSGCSMVKITLNGLGVPANGSRTIQPIANINYTLGAVAGDPSRTLANRAIAVVLPQTVTISSSTVKPLLLQALRTPNTTIVVENQVDMDLTDWMGPLHNIPVETGVTLKGGRTSREPGPRLYTTSRPSTFLDVVGDGVRITGMRIQGPDMGVVDGDGNARGIEIHTPNNVEIDNNELSGWCRVAVNVRNSDVPSGYLNPHQVRVHDNFIHHNQHSHGNGYGVATADGAYALIERNVFDYNRHAVTAEDGSDGSGYEANENLVLQHGGLSWWIPFTGYWTHTHQFDIHGQDNCGLESYNCGTAGHDAKIRRNTFLYTEDNAIKLRGTPQLMPYGVFVESNVFADGDSGHAVHQNESGMFLADNQFGVDGSAQLGSCDFDGDGIADQFMATGATWWFASGGGTMQWTFLHASTKRLSEVQLGDFDGDARCDVKVGTTVFSGGKTVLNNPPVGGGGGVLQ